MTAIRHLEHDAQRPIWAFWLDALMAYKPDEIREAFLEFTRSGSKYPNPQGIIAIIERKRARIAKDRRKRRLADQHRREQEEAALRAKNKITPDKAADILSEFGYG